MRKVVVGPEWHSLVCLLKCSDARQLSIKITLIIKQISQKDFLLYKLGQANKKKTYQIYLFIFLSDYSRNVHQLLYFLNKKRLFKHFSIVLIL